VKNLVFIALILLFAGCGTKPVRAVYQPSMVPHHTQQVSVQAQKREMQAERRPMATKIMQRKAVKQEWKIPLLPKEDIYSLEEDTISKFEEDCEELYFRKDVYYNEELKNNPLSIISALNDIEKNILKYNCRR